MGGDAEIAAGDEDKFGDCGSANRRADAPTVTVTDAGVAMNCAGQPEPQASVGAVRKALRTRWRCGTAHVVRPFDERKTAVSARREPRARVVLLAIDSTPARRTLGSTADLMSAADVEDNLKRDATWLSPEEKRRERRELPLDGGRLGGLLARRAASAAGDQCESRPTRARAPRCLSSS